MKKYTKYDPEKYNKAIKYLALRMIVAVYLSYLAFKIASGDDTKMSRTLCWIFGGVFMAASICFIIYSNKAHRAALEDAKIGEEYMTEVGEDEIDTVEAAVEETDTDNDISVNENV